MPGYLNPEQVQQEFNKVVWLVVVQAVFEYLYGNERKGFVLRRYGLRPVLLYRVRVCTFKRNIIIPEILLWCVVVTAVVLPVAPSNFCVNVLSCFSVNVPGKFPVLTVGAGVTGVHTLVRF